MMNWEYKEHPKYTSTLENQTYEILKQLWNGSLDIRSSISDTRIIHKRLFRELTPDGRDYFAGHYRGENFLFLQDYEVKINGNPNVGYPAENVPTYMTQFSKTVIQGMDRLDNLHQLPTPPNDRLRKTVNFACAAFVKFTQIHPYANGNGHIGRFLLISALKKYGYEVKNWTIDPRPVDPPYTNLIRLYEYGDKESLHKWILQQIPIL